MVERLLRLPAVLALRGVGKWTHYDEIRRGVCPRGVLIGRHAVAWPESEIAALNAARIAGKSEDELRDLVHELVATRAKATKRETR